MAAKPKFLQGVKLIPGLEHSNWMVISEKLKGGDEAWVKQAILTEASNKRRLTVISRLLGRLSVLRRDREREELIKWMGEIG